MSEFRHQPILVAEVLAALAPRPNGRYLDGTLGGGGHAAAILAASTPTGWLYGCDRDGASIEAVRARLSAEAHRLELRQGNYADIDQWVPAASCDGAVLDLGASSPQLDQAGRGFSFQAEGPLDMRMDERQSLTAAAILATTPVEELARRFWAWGGETEARRVAQAIDRERRLGPIQTTQHLARLIERVKPRRGHHLHPATKVFLALRLWVNDELGSLERGLPAVWRCLKPGGRLAVITFHSVEDRWVKQFGRARARDYVVDGPVDVPELRSPRPPELRFWQRKPIRPSAEEQAVNPRSRSAQLRVFEKL